MSETSGRRPWRRGAILIVAAVIFYGALLLVVDAKGDPSAPSAGGKLVFEDAFERTDIGKKYLQGEADHGHRAGVWKIVDGRLVAEKIHNAGLWLQTSLPERVRVEFDVRAESPTGDLKCEIFGDGITHQSGYVVIMGGWRNSTNCIARQDDHGEDRKNDLRCPRPGNKVTCVEPVVDYRWAIQRTGDTVEWFVDGVLMLTYPDRHPLTGRHFAFNNWEAKVSFDNLAIYDLDAD